MNELPIKYSFPPVADKGCQILILGTLPSVQSLEKRQNYGNPQNHFWRLVYALFGAAPHPLYEDRKAFLLSHRIAMWDSIRSATNPGSMDCDIKNVVPNDFDWFFKEYPNIKHIFFNGAKSQEVFRKFYPALYNAIPHTRLPSSSPIPTQSCRNFDEKLKQWMIVKEVLDSLTE